MKSINRPKLFIAVFIMAAFLSTSPACKTSEGVSKEVRDAGKVQEQQEKEAQKEYEAAVKKHRDQQSDYAKKLMKDMKKQQKKNNKIRKRSIWDQLFRRNCNR